jgi:hypothetical protein
MYKGFRLVDGMKEALRQLPDTIDRGEFIAMCRPQWKLMDPAGTGIVTLDAVVLAIWQSQSELLCPSTRRCACWLTCIHTHARARALALSAWDELPTEMRSMVDKIMTETGGVVSLTAAYAQARGP